MVLSTVRDAHDRYYEVFVLADATADSDPDTHHFLAEKIFPRQAYVIQISELERLFSAPRRRSVVDDRAEHHIVVGVDGSAGSAQALAWAVRQARIAGAVLRVVTCWRHPRPYGFEIDRSRRRLAT